MKAAVCYEFGKPLVVEDVEIDSPGRNEVKVKMAATAICHSDIHALIGELGPMLPLVAGHESAGYVEEVGEGVTTVKPGDSVVVSLLISCGHCLQCVSGRPHICEYRWPQVSHLKTKDGNPAAVMAPRKARVLASRRSRSSVLEVSSSRARSVAPTTAGASELENR